MESMPKDADAPCQLSAAVNMRAFHKNTGSPGRRKKHTDIMAMSHIKPAAQIYFKKGQVNPMNGLSKFKKGAKRVFATVMSGLMAVACVDGAAAVTVANTTVDAASGTLSNAQRSVIYSSTRSDFRDESIYFAMTTRFYNGDTSNDVQCWEVNQETGSFKGSYEADNPAWRGDFKGLAQKLDYIKALGFTAIWITPVVENCSGYDYHGYHAINFKKVDPRYESNDFTYQDLINAVHAKGMKLIQDVVYNHTGNFGETNLLPMFKKEGDLSSPSCLVKITNDLPANYDSLDPDPQYQARLALMKDTDGQHHDVNNIYHHYGHFNWDDYSATLGQIDGDCVDLNTENPIVYKYIVEAYSKYIDMGVDAFRVDTVRHISRLTLNKAINQQLLKASERSRDLRNGYDFFMFGEVCCRYSTIWYREHPCISTPYYTWKSTGNYAWSDDPADWETNYDSAIQECLDNTDNISEQPTSTNAFLNGNNYHKPDYSQYSGLSVIDFPMHWNFRDASGAFGTALSGDKFYNDCTWNVTYVDSHDYAPDHAPEDQRFAGDQETWAENLSLMFSFRGIPCIYYGSEIEFQKGCPIDKGATQKLSGTGRAYYGDNIEGNIVTSDFTVFNASGKVAETLKHPLAQHIIRLNRIRQAIPALRKGQYSVEGVSGNLAYKRRYTDSNVDSFACIVVSGSATFSGIPNGTYVDAVTGDTKTVSGGSLSISASRKGDLRVYVLNGPGRVVPDGKYLGSGSGELIGNEDVEIVEATGITLNASSASVREGESTVLKATITPANATDQSVTWTSSDTSVATVAGGNVSGVSKGTATITAKTSNGKTATCKITVTENTSIIKPTGIKLDKSSLELTAGETGSLTATVLPSDATNKTVTWTSDNTAAATVNSAGQITAVKEGTAVITASTYNGYTATCTVTVKGKQFEMLDHGIYFEKPSGWGNSINVYTYDIVANSTIGAAWPGTAMKDMGDGLYGLECSFTDANLRMIFNDGSNQSPGRDIEGFKFQDQGYYTVNGFDHIVEKIDDVEVTSVSISPASLSLKVGATGTLTGSVAPSNATNKTLTWTSNKTSVATVSSAGVVTAVAEGTATITAKSNNGKTATATVTVTKQDDPVTELLNESKISATEVGKGTAVKLTGKASGGTSPYTYAFYYKSSNDSNWTSIGTPFGSATTGSYTPTEAGSYNFKVTVKDSAGTTVSKTFGVTVTDVAELVNKSSCSSSVNLGSAIKITGSATGGTTPYTFAYYYKRTTNTKWNTIGTEFGTSASASFTPTSAGTFDVKVIVKDKSGKTAEKTFTASAVDNNTLKTGAYLNAEKVQIGDDIRITGNASGGSGKYTYTFFFKRSTNTKWNSIKSKGTYAIVVPTAAASYDVKCIVTDSKSKTAETVFTVPVVKSLPLTNVSTINKPTTVAANTTITVAGRAVGGTKPVSYQFFFKRSANSTWNKLSYGNDAHTYAKFTPTAKASYDLRVVAIDAAGTIASKTFTITST